ncbi:hypothetical protein AB0I28_22980 [Phytomonospora sp. NPDC050363]|uniref:hypothetical protein n=1 Tax=Phytomonospora sp. NPDC050363 TaxID=3155642 RepID=UPI0033E66346
MTAHAPRVPDRVPERPDDPVEPEDFEPPDRVYAPVLGVTLAWYVVPGVLFVFWSMLFGGGAAASTCGPGLACDQGGDDPRLAIIAALPWLGLAFASSLMTAVLLRMLATTWRAISAGTAAAVIGAGLSTLLLELIT